MIDSGSAVSIITEKALLTLPPKSISPCPISILDYSSNPIRTCGIVSLCLFPGTKRATQHEFVIVPSKYMAEDLILGMDALSKGSVYINHSRRTFAWNGYHLTIQYGSTTNMRNLQVCLAQQFYSSPIVLQENLVLRPGEILHTKIPALPNTVYYIEAQPVRKIKASVLLAKHFLLATNEEPFLQVPLTNMGSKLVRLNIGTKLGAKLTIPDQKVEYLSYQGQNLGSKGQTLQTLHQNLGTETQIPLCPTHTFALTSSIPDPLGKLQFQPANLWDCRVCQGLPCLENPSPVVRSTTVIENAMLPSSLSETPPGNSRSEKLQELLKDVDVANIGSKNRKLLDEVILKHEQLFILGDRELGLIKVPENHINLVDETPVRMPLYRHPEKAKEIIQVMIKDMLDKDVIEPSYAAYLSPIVLINKPDGSKRMCIDYRAVNAKIKIDIHPLPRLDELVDDVSGHAYYCTLDLKDAYYQCLLDPQSRDITTFSDGRNLFRFKRLPFGLSVAPAIFTRVMQEVLRPLLALGFVKNYLDDVIIFAPTIESILERLDLVFTRMKEMGLKLNVSKCHFVKRKIKFLGHYVSQKGIEVNPNSIESISKMNPPRSTKEVRRFIGMASFYRKFIPHFAGIAAPLTTLQSKKVPFYWNDECQKAFETLKQKLTETPVLTKVKLGSELELHTDASNFHVGAVLMQREPDGLHPVGYYSKKLNKCEQKYTTSDKEALGIVKATRFFHHFLWGTRFKIVTDHQPLTYIFKRRTHSPRMSRYMLEMREYNFDIVYKKGANNHVPDALSRPNSKSKSSNVKIHNIKIQEIFNKLKFPGLTPDKIKEEQRKDKRWIKVIKYCEGGALPKRTPGNRTLSCFELIDGILYMRREEFRRIVFCLVIPESLKAVACHISHDHTHLGQHKSVRQSQLYFYWPSQWKDIVHYVKSCQTCQQFKPSGALVHQWQELPSVENKGQRIAIDLIDMHAGKGGYRYCLTVIDHFSRFLRAYPLRNKGSDLVLKALRKDLSIFGVPAIAVMDNGSEFTSKEFKKYCTQLGIKQVFCLPYHPRGNSVLERAHRTLKSVLAMLSNAHPNHWPDKLCDAVKILNESVHVSLSTSPFFVQFGYHPTRQVGNLTLPEYDEMGVELRRSSDLRKEIREYLKTQTQKYRDKANVKRRNNPLQASDLVWIYQETPIPGTAVKLNRKWLGPYKVVEIIDGGRGYELENVFDGTKTRRAAEKVKRFIEREPLLENIREDFLTREEENEIITDVRIRRPPDRYQP